MAEGISMKVAGLAEIQRKLLELPNRVNRRVVRHSLVAGAQLVRDEARLQAPVWTGPVSEGHPPPGTLKRSIIIKFIPEQTREGKTVYYVTVRHGKKFQHQGKGGKLSQDAFYWWFVEFKKAHNRNSKAFMRPAFELKKDAAKDAIIESLRLGVLDQAARL